MEQTLLLTGVDPASLRDPAVQPAICPAALVKPARQRRNGNGNGRRPAFRCVGVDWCSVCDGGGASASVAVGLEEEEMGEGSSRGSGASQLAGSGSGASVVSAAPLPQHMI